MRSIAVIGGGASGLMAAGTAREYGAEVTLFERNAKLGRKLAITGKGRCNVTNNCTVEEFLKNVVTNPRFLYSAISGFSPEDAIDFFERRHVPLKTERGRRVFPVSDSAYDIVDALASYASRSRIINKRVTEVAAENGKAAGVYAAGVFYPFDAVIICTGGLSYPGTGSDGDGYRFAGELGHTVNKPRPALVSIDLNDGFCRETAGLSLKNIALTLTLNGKKVFSELGELLFTHTGISGPLVLTASSLMKAAPASDYLLTLDLKPALDRDTLDKRLLSDFDKYSHRDFINALGDLLPLKLIPVITDLSGINARKKVHDITRAERIKLCGLIKSFPLSIKALRPIEEAVVTAGGVSVKEINPSTMESKLIKGLYFAGEVLDVDALTGGYNLQIAFSTGRRAGMSAAKGN